MPHPLEPRIDDVAPTTTSETLAGALPREMVRVTALVPIYRSVPLGGIAAGLMELSVARAQRAIDSGDVVALIEAYRDLQGYSL